jgi:allantoin racemase
VGNRRAQQSPSSSGPDIEFDYRPVKAGPALYDSHHDGVLADVSMFEAGLTAEKDGYDAVCIDTMSDFGRERAALGAGHPGDRPGGRPSSSP